jgi:chromate transport protein ChrA
VLKFVRFWATSAIPDSHFIYANMNYHGPQNAGRLRSGRDNSGPLIIVVAFVGFLAGYNHFHGSLWMGTLGLLATTFYTFLACFFFVFAGAPLVERTRNEPMIRNVLELISAIVVGAIVDLTLFLGKAAIFPSGVVGVKQLNAISVAGVMLSLLLLQRFKLKIIHVILLGIGFGSIRYFLVSDGDLTNSRMLTGRHPASTMQISPEKAAGGKLSPRLASILAGCRQLESPNALKLQMRRSSFLLRLRVRSRELRWFRSSTFPVARLSWTDECACGSRAQIAPGRH